MNEEKPVSESDAIFTEAELEPDRYTAGLCLMEPYATVTRRATMLDVVLEKMTEKRADCIISRGSTLL